MNKMILMLTVLASAGLAACDRQPVTVNVPTPVAVPGPAGATGATGSTGSTGATGDAGATGRTGGNTTVIVVPPAASAPSN